MSESETYKELGALTRCKERWEECIPYVASLLTSDSVKIQAKALWMLGEMGLAFPEAIKSSVPVFAGLLHDIDEKVRMEAPEIFRVLGKRRPDFVAPYLDELHHIAETDTNRVVRIHCQGAIRAAIGTNDYICIRQIRGI